MAYRQTLVIMLSPFSRSRPLPLSRNGEVQGFPVVSPKAKVGVSRVFEEVWTTRGSCVVCAEYSYSCYNSHSQVA